MYVRFSLVFLCLLTGTGWRTTAGTVDLSPEERAYLDGISPIRFAYDPEFEPFESTSPDGGYQGVAAEYLALVADRLGVEMELQQPGSWPEAVEAAREGNLDLLPCIGRNPERETFLEFSRPYLEFARVAVTRKDFEYRALTDLPGDRVAVQRASSHLGYLRTETDLNPALYDTFEAALLAVASGERDAVVGNLATVTHFIQNKSLANLRIAGPLGGGTFSLHMAVRKELQPLVPLLDRALATVSLPERARILDRWIPLPRVPDEALELTRKQREWLLANPILEVGWDPGWAPVEFEGEDGWPRGYSVDMLRELERHLGVQFVYGPARPWPETLADLKAGRLDLVSCIGKWDRPGEKLVYTRPYLTVPTVLFSRPTTPYIRSLTQLEGRVVAVPRGYTLAEWLSREHPGIVQLPVATVEEGLRAVDAGRAVAYVGSVMEGNYYLSRMRNVRLVISGEVPHENRMRMGVRTGGEMLRDILDQAIAAVPEENRTAMYRKWVWVDYRHRVDYGLVVKVGLLGLLGVLLVVSGNRRLRRAEREVSASRAELERSYQELRELERQKENLTHMIVHDMRSPLTVVTGALDMAREFLRENSGLFDKGRGAVDMARTSADEINRMVDALLDVSRLEEGKMPVNRTRGDLGATVRSALTGLRGLAERKELDLSVDGGEVEAEYDESLIRRVMVNLVSNAIKACNSGGKVRIRVERVAEGAQVEVEDTGCGIEARFLDRIFEKFTQLEETRKRGVNASSGIGLAFCRLAVEAHGGFIEVESTPGEGSTFRFVLPEEEAREGK